MPVATIAVVIGNIEAVRTANSSSTGAIATIAITIIIASVVVVVAQDAFHCGNEDGAVPIVLLLRRQ